MHYTWNVFLVKHSSNTKTLKRCVLSSVIKTVYIFSVFFPPLHFTPRCFLYLPKCLCNFLVVNSLVPLCFWFFFFLLISWVYFIYALFWHPSQLHSQYASISSVKWCFTPCDSTGSSVEWSKKKGLANGESGIKFTLNRRQNSFFTLLLQATLFFQNIGSSQIICGNYPSCELSEIVRRHCSVVLFYRGRILALKMANRERTYSVLPEGRATVVFSTILPNLFFSWNSSTSLPTCGYSFTTPGKSLLQAEAFL